KELLDVLDDARPRPAAPVTSDSDETAIGNMLFWKRVHRSLEEGLEKVSLKELVDEARRIRKGKPHVTFNFNI
ncbi:MAG TPA: hypothetical protein VL404_02355, partial [Candidatus Eisenbacteria bacterium]|nr:hypothetical protein [Candidatus Eisenbacteria bacterium]